MPYKNIISGIYSISTPNGSVYVGSSNNIYRRWSEHRRNLRSGTHRSARLQAAWEKHKDLLEYKIVFVCEVQKLEEMEQKFIKDLGAKLNTTNYVNNVWTNPETRKKLEIIHSSAEWKRARSEIAKRTVANRRVAVDCSNGKRYESLAAAANDFGIKPSGIRHLASTQRVGRLGVRFKYSKDVWMDVLPHYEQAWVTRISNGKTKHSDAAKEKMRKAKIGFIPHNKGVPCTEETKIKISRAKILKNQSKKVA